MSTTTTQTRTVLTTVGSDEAVDVKQYPKLSREQAGHLRHFHNLVSQPDGQWNHMGAQEAMQEFLDAYRYQLATMAYASSVTHYHRLPVLHSVFKDLHRRLILKMLRREVWGYWFNTSVSGSRVDPGLQELRKPWADPVVRENIMYSGHLLLMVSLYAMLFDDDEFERENGLKFEWDPIFWGFGSETFSYSTRTLQEAIMREMERTGYLGVCCEPNMVFIICNQFPILAVRYNDVRHNKNESEGLLEKYLAAWQKKGGFMGPNEQFQTAWMQRQDVIMQWPGPAGTAWASAYMNSWNSDFVKSKYDGAAFGHISNTDGFGIKFNPTAVGNAFRNLVEKEGASSTSDATLKQAKEVVKEENKKKPAPTMLLQKLTQPELGYIVQWLSELGKTTELTSILKDADNRLKPTWERGGLFYPRNDVPFSDDLDWTHMDPYTGNAAIGYSRLNVPDGQKKMYEAPWTRETLQARPWVDGVGLGDGVDFLRGAWDEERKCIVLTMRTWDGKRRNVKPVVKNLDEGRWKVLVNGEVVSTKDAKKCDSLDLVVEVDGNECNVVVAKE